MTDTDAFLRELHHRVKNNFQIIASLMNLQKRMLPPERRRDLRFIEEHVQSMAVAYRVVYATRDLVSVSIYELVTEVLDGLLQIAGGRPNQMTVEIPTVEETIGLNQAIALSLYLAVVVPPFIDHAIAHDGLARVALAMVGEDMVLSCGGNWTEPVAVDFLRSRLLTAYLHQLNATVIPDLPAAERRIRFHVEAPRPGLV